jgi:transposase
VIENDTISCSKCSLLENKIDELHAVVKQLEEKISLIEGSRSSRTSSTAPSHDIGRSNRISLRSPSGKKPGGQPGHAGSTLSMSDAPDEIVDHQPSSCLHCGTDLHAIDSTSFISRQIFDIPPPPSLECVEHRSHVKTCPKCLLQTRGVFPDSLRGPVQYGPRIEAMTGYLSVYQYLPYDRIRKLFKAFYGLHLSTGSLDTFLDNLSDKAGFAYETIRSKLLTSPVVGADETGCRVNGKNHWFHVWQTPALTFIVAFVSRGYAAIEKHFSDGLIHSVYVSDCLASQLKVEAKAHQLCLVHLLRELTNFAEKLKRQWSVQMKELFKKAIEFKKTMTEKDYINPPEEVLKLNKQLDELLEIDFSEFHSKEKSFIKRLIKHRQSIFTFLTHQYVPPDNNASEQAIRNVKVKMKVSGGFRNKEGKGAERYAKIRSVVDTTIKNGQDVYAAMIELANYKMIGVSE